MPDESREIICSIWTIVLTVLLFAAAAAVTKSFDFKNYQTEERLVIP